MRPRVTQVELAARSGGLLSRSAIANIESGRQRVAMYHLYVIAEALGCAPQELLPAIGDVEQQEPTPRGGRLILELAD